MALSGCLVGIGILTDLESTHRAMFITTGLVGMLYSLALPTVLIALARRHNALWLGLILINSLMVNWLLIIEPFSFKGIGLTACLILTLASAVLMGRWQSYTFMVLTMLMYRVLPLILHTGISPVSTGIQIALVGISIGITETIYLMQKRIEHDFQRLKVVNQMTRSLAYSIETSQVMSLMSGAIQAVLDADTYFIGLVQDDHINLKLFYDDGEFFSNMSIDREGTLGGWVVNRRRSLLLTDAPNQLKDLGLDGKIIGKPHVSLSWMGTPLQTPDHVFGVVAVASYKRNAFNNSDLELLENFAQQASITLDNAYHHAEVEEQSTQDSLTRVLNHSNFLKHFLKETEKAAQHHYPLSVIMLDVDHFKKYNDNYGHLVGDQVLVGLSELVRRYTKSSDLVGRWGGEEFIIALPQTSGIQANLVAERIRKAINRMEVFDRENNHIPPPTVSQGIALFPQESDRPETLLDMADKRMLLAKNRGRDQIEPPAEHWHGIQPHYINSSN
ncbi:MAG: sensor domain-containing diguanylate cyclase [Anaerolineae bacterium]|nr:sensor domain-containing diguanylate cyclase [Anaerolineae bacterium]